MDPKDASVLVVEDEAIMLMDLQFALEDHGLQVATASDIATAEDVAARQSFKVAILDLNLPQGSTLDLANRLYAEKTKIVFISGSKVTADQIALLDAAQFQKPFDVDKICAYVKSIV